ncbi:transcription initiation factor TFIID subunit 5 [Caerostris extrusa]|uniref:Transcription initiation factor TFIID subunit 5 n=1 Tax=Caerostris extrusa TaxID=172846 RepID=A0AAV4N217_CAEEX|nr:transcription initiation factor TFIID subunit 5 [Caerostris extrusa]
MKKVTSAEFCEDSSLLSAGTCDSLVKIWSLTNNKLKAMKSALELENVDKEADDVLYRMMDEKTAKETRTLIGHSGPVYGTSFSPDKNLLLSCSEDCTVRLWSLQTWSNVVCYKGHCFPVWDVKFSPYGYYFATCGHDKLVRLWVTDNPQPIRLFSGHVSDVDVMCVQFHPNSNYIATGSSDRTIRLWDVLSGSCVRFMTGHKGSIHSLAFSTCGRFLASAGSDKKIIIWDIAYGHLLAELSGHNSTIYTLSFSREGSVLVSGGLDNCIKIWDMTKLLEDIDLEDLNISHAPNVKVNSDSYLLTTYRTKATPVLTTHFTRRNLLLGAGMYIG